MKKKAKSDAADAAAFMSRTTITDTPPAAEKPTYAFGPGRTKSGTLKGSKRLGLSTDPTFGWVRTVCLREGQTETPVESWRALAEQYMTIRNSVQGNYSRVLNTLRHFLEHYAWRHGFFEPEKLLTTPRVRTLPPLRGARFSDAPYRNTPDGAMSMNCLHDFLTWVIAEKFSSDEDGHTVAFPGFRVPFERAVKRPGGTSDESVRAVLVYPVICELRARLAPGENFRDWQWAHGATGKHSGEKAGSWFEVDPKVIDKTDPDCVWRKRERQLRNYQLPDPDPLRSRLAVVATTTVYEMWSPVTAVALLAKLEMPWRTFQTRMLDSGETDVQCIELDPEGERQFLAERRAASAEQDSSLEPESRQFAHSVPLERERRLFVWNENPNREELLRGLNLDERDRVAEYQGVFLRQRSHRGGESVGFFVNTNKTADQDKAWHLRGYKIPYQHDSLHRWMVKLRNWQRSYNPITKPIVWTDLDTGQIRPMRSLADLKAAAPTCFLFRHAAAKGKNRNAEGPISDANLDRLWTRLLFDLEEEKAKAGEKDAEGKPIRFIKKHARDPGHGTTFFPLHSLRVSLITALADGGMELDLLMKLAGHTRLVMTIYYRKINPHQMSEGMRNAQETLVRRADELTVAALKGQSYDQMPKYVVADEAGLRAALPENTSNRNSVGWERQFGGWCLMGGNTVPTADDRSGGGCFNGGKCAKGGLSRANRFHARVRPKACMECDCRWFVSRPEYILEIRAKVMLLLTRLTSVQQRLNEAADQLTPLAREKIRAEHAEKTFARLSEYRRVELLHNHLATEVDEVLQGIANCSKLSDRVLAIAMLDEEPGQQWVAQGTSEDVKWAIQPVNSELLVLSDVCLNAEIYPELAPDSEGVIVRRSQLLDVHLQNAGAGMIFAPLTPAQQNVLANRFIRELAKSVNDNLPAAVALIEKGGSPLVSKALETALAEARPPSIPLRNLLKS